MRNSKRNIPDEFSPQNPLNKTDITPDSIQGHLEDKIPVEDIVKPEDDLTTDEMLRRERLRKQSDLDRQAEEPGL
jgi:hypothetical protein